ncbi:2-oxoadipate dehydrogenase complex component E1-like [Oppia nitens]|uniref:2-oxoadipate dehydrogenase complex component E1-like n=1 Tax=Oppia nitens TaxID=1686743 RepID=UPI0023D9A6D2|nr:2-oxoadipate dehydrogenase complex component E1-like [Oppia nitens]
MQTNNVKKLSKNKSNDKSSLDVHKLVDTFRCGGHLLSRLDPLSLNESRNWDVLPIELTHYETSDQLIDPREFVNISGNNSCKVKDLLSLLKETYSGNISIEFMHLNDANERQWIANKWEHIVGNDTIFSLDDKKRLAMDLLKSELFDQFLTKKFSSVKRYGGEGAETMITFFEHIFHESCHHGVTDIVIGMPHRGRLNLLTNSLNYPPVMLFQKMLGKSEFNLQELNGITGDVLSHLFTSIDRRIDDNNKVHIILLPNPSHLEAISPVVCGKARGKAMTKQVGPYGQTGDILPILGIQVHGDAAFSGQGIIMETLAMANVPHYSVDGSIHLIVNNQIGYTTPGQLNHGRSSVYCSDALKIIDSPCIHVNGGDPESVVKAAQFALEYRHKFRKDIAIDLVCYRQWGHNELDDPTFTNPIMYSKIHSLDMTIPQKYSNQVLTKEEQKAIVDEYTGFLNKNFQEIDSYKVKNTNFNGVWNGITMASDKTITRWDTSVLPEILYYICGKSIETPKEFNLHQNLNKVLNDRINRIKEGVKIDWATAEALAFGSLLYQGFNVRLSGQDVGRGTFSQRHVMLVDQKSGDTYIPLNHLNDNQKGFIEVCNSILSEEAVLAYEWGHSIDNPNNLVVWEAQFGDFFNGAQIIFDTFISSGEAKWGLSTALTLLLPHGMDGAGPEHSSARIERFLQMSDSKESSVDSDHINWSIVNPTTPAQYFHVLRRQLIRNYRKPLIVITPKILLRHPSCVSTINEFIDSTFFRPVLSDPIVTNQSDIKTVVFCSGKHYYTLSKEREDRNAKHIALVRLEELCPFPANEVLAQLLAYKSAKDFIWSQEEHQNMGAWSYVRPRFDDILNCKLRYVGRPSLCAPAVGIGELHKKEITDIIDNIFKK